MCLLFSRSATFFSHFADVRTTTDDHHINSNAKNVLIGLKAEREPPPFSRIELAPTMMARSYLFVSVLLACSACVAVDAFVVPGGVASSSRHHDHLDIHTPNNCQKVPLIFWFDSLD